MTCWRICKISYPQHLTISLISFCFSNFRRRLRHYMSLSMPLSVRQFHKIHNSFEGRVRLQDGFMSINYFINSISLVAISRPWITVVLFMLIQQHISKREIRPKRKNLFLLEVRLLLIKFLWVNSHKKLISILYI